MSGKCEIATGGHLVRRTETVFAIVSLRSFDKHFAIQIFRKSLCPPRTIVYKSFFSKILFRPEASNPPPKIHFYPTSIIIAHIPTTPLYHHQQTVISYLLPPSNTPYPNPTFPNTTPYQNPVPVPVIISPPNQTAIHASPFNIRTPSLPSLIQIQKSKDIELPYSGAVPFTLQQPIKKNSSTMPLG